MSLPLYLLACFLPPLVTAGPVMSRAISGPVITENFPDPSFIDIGANVQPRYVAFATNNGQQNIPVATSNDFESWEVQHGYDALPFPGAWTNGQVSQVWAPDVNALDDGSYIMYYSARISDGSAHCVGAATSQQPAGPFIPQLNPIACPVSIGGAIDASGFQDVDGKRYVLWKVDGNSINQRTPIMIQQVAADGFTPVGDSVEILNNDPSTDGPLVEAPSLAVIDGIYFLFFSSNYFTTAQYDVSFAVSRNGPLNGGAHYTKAQDPLLETGYNTLGGLYAPGGLSVGSGPDNHMVVFMADQGNDARVRQMYVGTLSVDANAGTVSLYGRSDRFTFNNKSKRSEGSKPALKSDDRKFYKADR